MGVGYLTVQECNSDERKIFSKHFTRVMFRVNALLVVNAILMGVMVVLGAYGRYRRHPLTRYIFLGATALFIPIISYVLSDIGNQNGLILFADGEKIVGRMCNASTHMNLVLIWTGLVQMVGISTTLVVVSDPREGRNIGPSVALLVQAMWTSYLMVYNTRLDYYTSIDLGGTTTDTYIKWSLVNVFSPTGLVIVPPFALTFAKLLFKCFVWHKARKSLAIGCNPRLIVGYMEQLHDADMTNDYGDIPPPLIVMGEDTISVDKEPHGYSFALIPNRGGLVTLDKVWQLDDMHDLKLTSHLKDVCLSFALSKLLRCRFARYTNAKTGFTKASSFLRNMLLEDSNDERVLQLIEYELSFLHDVYFSSLVITYSESRMPILSILISLSGIGYCLLFTMARVYLPFILADRSTASSELISCLYRCLQFEGEQQGTTTHLRGQDFGSPAFDLVPIVVLVALVVLAEIREIAFYVCSNWTKVALICAHINHPSWQQSPIMQKCIRHVLQCRCKILNHWEDTMNQCSILVLHPRNTPMGLLRRLKPGQKVKVPRAVKAGIMNALRSYERSRNNNRMPSLCPRPQLKTGDNLLWVVDGTKGIAKTILVCHIATSILELRSAGSCQPLSDHKTAAIHLSRYCAYLVAYSPELLPEDDEWCKSLYKTVKKKAKHILAGMPTPKVDYQPLVELMSASQNHEVLKDGAKLGQQLAELNQGEANTAWELLAGFWSEMMLYIAPSDNIDGHSEAIARGGELITLVWALLAHLGIFSRAAGDPASITGESV
ncbi:uncharacterized protein [Aegilops tauschii subsp. strangulata]|uniref:DUF4220 domain-containing protein n=3 Tax=Aegilops tauschii TaxID=37682 RepID=A0A453DK08_AEGTS|nr:uncharacterized protein LOC123497197 [Aegilops tauschii subsp. strangulata]